MHFHFFSLSLSFFGLLLFSPVFCQNIQNNQTLIFGKLTIFS